MKRGLLLLLLPLAALVLRGETVLLDFGNDDSFRGVSVPSPDGNGRYWNSVRPGQYFAGLVDTDNEATSLAYGPGAHPTDSYNGPAGATTGPTELEIARVDIDPVALGDLAAAEAVIDYHAGVLGEPSGRFQLEGLDPDGTYTLSFYGAHKYVAEPTTRINIYRDPDRLDLLATADLLIGSTGAAHNRDTLAVFEELTPPANGILYFTFGGADGENSGYLNAMSVSTEGGGGDPDPPPDPEPSEGVKVVVGGSSVPLGGIIVGGPAYYHDYDEDGDDTGWGGSEDHYQIYGYAGRLRELLTDPVRPRVPGGSTTAWEFVNVSVPGNNTPLLLDRFDPDITRQYDPPKTAHGEPDYVVIALSMANEGLVFSPDPRSVFNQFRDGMLDLIEECRVRGYQPVITLVYPHMDYTPEKYALVKEMNLLMNTWGVPAINLLGAIDNGDGQWADGFYADAGHPNYIGHEEMFHAIPPTLFEAMEMDGKTEVPVYPEQAGSFVLRKTGTGAESLSFTPGATMRAFTTSFKVRTDTPGPVAAVKSKTAPRVLVDFGPSNDDDGRATSGPDAFERHWNSWRPTEGGIEIPAGTVLENLSSISGEATGIGLEVLTSFNGANGRQNGGLFGAAGPDPEKLGPLAVETATEDYFYTQGTSALKVTGLDPEGRYTFRFFGTRAADDPRETRYRVTGAGSDIPYSPFADIITSGLGLAGDGNGNDRAIGLVSGIRPRANGEIFLEVLPSEGSFGYLGLMEIVEENTAARYGVVEIRDGEVAYVAPDGREIRMEGSIADGEWHDIALSHRYAQQETVLFVDGRKAGVLRESHEPSRFLLGGGVSGSGMDAPADFEVQDWAVYRAAWTEEEAAAQAAGMLQHASMEILAPLDDPRPADGAALRNEAQTRSRILYHAAGPVSFWFDEEPDPANGGKLTGIGWIHDGSWPFFYHYRKADWLYAAEGISSGKDSFFAWSMAGGAWIWSSDLFGGWYYDYGRMNWYSFFGS